MLHASKRVALASEAWCKRRPSQLRLSSTKASKKPPLDEREAPHFSSYLVRPTDFLQKWVDSWPSLSEKPQPRSRIVPICAAWFMPNDPEKRTGLQSYENAHIPQARFFDIDAIKDSDSPYPHMLPTPEGFSKAVGNMGIRSSDTVVIYDTEELGIFSAPRVAWTFRAFGHPRVHVLNNFKIYRQMGLPIGTGPPIERKPTAPNAYKSPPKGVANFEYMKKVALGDVEGAVALDARSASRYSGADPEPRPGLSSGHMPKSVSLQFPELLDPDTMAFLPADRLREVFSERGVQDQKPIISSCGTGITAAIIDTALAEAGFPERQRKLYDGSWTEWAQRIEPEMIIKDSVR